MFIFPLMNIYILCDDYTSIYGLFSKRHFVNVTINYLVVKPKSHLSDNAVIILPAAADTSQW